MNLSLRSRLYIACGAIIAVLFVPAYYALGQLGELRDIAFDLRTRHAEAFLTVGRLQTSLAELNRLQRSYVAAPSRGVREELLEQVEQVERQGARLAAADTGEEAIAVREGIDTLLAATRQVDELMQGGRVDRATTALGGIRPLLADAHESLRVLAEVIEARSTADAVRAQRISETAARTSAMALFLALGVALALGLVSIGALTSPLRRLRSATAAVAGGEFVPPEDLPYGRSDEVGDLARSFRSMTERLAELDRLKAEFVSIASHELKTPVSVIRGYAEMLEEGFYGEVNGKQREVLGYIEEQTDVLVERVNQLLSLSRLEAQGRGLEIQEVRTSELLRELHRTFRPLAARQEIDFRVEAASSAPDSFHGDRSRVAGELLGNLIANAFKFTPAGGRVTVRAGGKDDRIVFEVSDTGEGIPPAQLPYIFEKYYQAGHHAGKIGTGLGLAIAREIVQAHGGTIRAESEPGRGTTFRVELPVGPPEGTEPGVEGSGATEVRAASGPGRDRGPGRERAPAAARS